MENIKLARDFLQGSVWKAGMTADNGEKEPLELPIKEGTKQIILPEPDMLADQDVNFLEMVELRTSVRKYSEKPLNLKELSYLLWCTQGVKMVKPKSTRRTVPSAGAKHPFETYLLVNNVEGLVPGVYRFLALEHSLIKVNVDKDKTIASFTTHVFVEKSAVTFVWSAVIKRTTNHYGLRGYRYAFLDAGHVCQNLYLAGYSIDCGVCALGSFDDNIINRLFGFKADEQFVIYGASVGKKVE